MTNQGDISSKASSWLASFLGAICAGIIVFMLAYGIRHLEIEADSRREQAHAEQRVKDAAASLSTLMSVRLNLTSSLGAFVKTHIGFSAEEFDTFASMLQRDLPGIISLQLAPNGVVTYLTDIERNQKALGHDLLKDPARRHLAEQSIRENSYIIAGPIDLIQGGQAIIARRPLYLPEQSLRPDGFWGFATVLIDLNAILKVPRLEELSDDFDVAIRGKDGLGAEGEVFVGDPLVFAKPLAIADVKLPNASWQIAVAYSGKHEAGGFILTPGFWWLTAIIVLVTMRMSFLILDKPRHLNAQIARATASLQKEVQTRIRAEERAQHMAQHDSLTSLPNRRLFDELARQSIAAAKRDNTECAVLFIDIDDFKKINDTYGHDAGDQVLVTLSSRLKACVRGADVVARFGGDEFVILLTNIHDRINVEKVARAIITSVVEPIPALKASVEVGASIGISLYPLHGDHLEGLLKKADAAMYTTKEQGKKGFCTAKE